MMTTEMNINPQIDFIPDMTARLAGNITQCFRACCVIKVITFVRQIETMILADECEPGLRMQGELGIEIMNILPPYPVHISQIIMAERKKMMKRTATAVIGIFIPGSKIVA